MYGFDIDVPEPIPGLDLRQQLQFEVSICTILKQRTGNLGNLLRDATKKFAEVKNQICLEEDIEEGLRDISSLTINLRVLLGDIVPASGTTGILG